MELIIKCPSCSAETQADVTEPRKGFYSQECEGCGFLIDFKVKQIVSYDAEIYVPLSLAEHKAAEAVKLFEETLKAEKEERINSVREVVKEAIEEREPFTLPECDNSEENDPADDKEIVNEASSEEIKTDKQEGINMGFADWLKKNPAGTFAEYQNLYPETPKLTKGVRQKRYSLDDASIKNVKKHIVYLKTSMAALEKKMGGVSNAFYTNNLNQKHLSFLAKELSMTLSTEYLTKKAKLTSHDTDRDSLRRAVQHESV